jgi:hypothetical protein
MTLAAFQQALCALIRSPDVCRDVRAGDDAFFSHYELSPRERARLLDIVGQRGMSTNCTLYRQNRVTPIYTLLHYTCLVLGDDLKDTLDAYWGSTELRDLEFKPEIERFARFVRTRIESSAVVNPLLEDVLAFELALNELRFAPRREILRRLRDRPEDAVQSSCLRLHPLTRLVKFRHHPGALLDALARGRVPRELPAQESYLLLSVIDEDMRAHTLDPSQGRPLWQLQEKGGSAAPPDVDELIERGVLLRSDHAPTAS